MKTFLLGAASAVVMTAAAASAQPAASPATTPQVQVRSERIHMGMQTRDQVVAHVREMFARFDTNRDGFITQQEVAAAHKDVQLRVRKRMGDRMHSEAGPGMRPLPDRGSAFDRLDANHDGVITRDEFVNARPQLFKREIRIVRNGHGELGGMHRMRGGMMKHMFAMADANHDGRVSVDEATAAALRHFDMADANHNGRLDPGEHMQMRRRVESGRRL